ncbi:mediator of RNA polymerase II transcription subunit 9-like [Argiope bruennichi]|uniref:mediator of RNA polymerase II transcription subunit 9-like n=1 Tax=Argiope bruennichi TaxID=94029 RepID=UPI002494C509|nr:mediator of RNA polymerase II transcription subunit 9-like [Argiope bruennichi]
MTQAENVNTDFLPIIYDIIRSIEKETYETTQKPHENTDSNLKIPELRTKLQQCREQIQKLPGIDYTKEEQQRRLEALREQLIQKRQLLLKYKNMCHFDNPKI